MYVGLIRVFVIRLEVYKKTNLWKAIFDKSAHQDPHLFHIQMGPSVKLTPHGDPRGVGGGYSDLFFIRRLGPRIYRSPQKISRITSTPKNILHTPINIHFSEPLPPPKKKKKNKYWIQNFEPKKWPKPTYVWKYQSTYLPTPPPPPGTETFIRCTFPCGQRMKNPNSVFNVKLMYY